MSREQTKTISCKLNAEYSGKFDQLAEKYNGKKSDTIKALIDGQIMVSRPEITAQMVQLMTAIDAMNGLDCDEEAYTSLMKVGERLCQLLSTN